MNTNEEKIVTISGVVHDVRVVKSFNDRGLPELCVTIAIKDKLNTPSKRLRFNNARSFEMQTSTAFYTEVVEIAPIAEYGWEGCNYHVREEAGNLFSFYCESYEYES